MAPIMFALAQHFYAVQHAEAGIAVRVIQAAQDMPLGLSDGRLLIIIVPKLFALEPRGPLSLALPTCLLAGHLALDNGL